MQHRPGTQRIFGYGSLVNGATHAYRQAHRARLQGWIRFWQHTTRREVAFLNVRPCAEPGAAIDGLVLEVPARAPELDARERAYSRQPVSPTPLPAPPGGAQGPEGGPPAAAEKALIFAIPPEASDARNAAGGAAPACLLLSYIDVVVQGYLREFGEAGVQRFFESTRGWQAPLIDDRAAPRYPRAQDLSRAERALVDHWLRRIGAG